MKSNKNLLLGRLLGSRLLGSLLGSGLLSSGLLGSLRLGSLLSLGLGSLLGSRLLGSLLGSRLLSSGLLGSLRLGSLLSLRLLSLLGLGLLGSGLLGGQFEGASSLLASSSSRHHLLGSNQLPQGKLHTDGGLVGIGHLVVGDDVLEDGLAGGSLLVFEGLDGGHDHVGVRGVGGRLGSLLHLGGLGDLGGCLFGHG